MIKLLKFLLSIIIAIAIIYSLYWLGIKGMVGASIGMIATCYFFLTKNRILMVIVKIFNGQDYLQEMIESVSHNEDETKKH